MPNKMLIDASHPEETRVVVVRGSRIEEFDFESQDKKQLKGNIYLARVTRVEPSLQAAFVEYGGNRHGFLAFSEIHPDYYQIPVADRQALLRAEADEAEDEDDEDGDDRERNRGNRRRRRGGKSRDRGESSARSADGSDDATNSALSDDRGDSQVSDDPSSEDHSDHSTDEQPFEHHGSEDHVSDDSHAAGEVHPSRMEAIVEESQDDQEPKGEGPTSIAAAVDADVVSEKIAEPTVTENDRGGVVEEVHSVSHDDHEVESVGAEDALEEVRNRRKPARRHYKIQEVIKRRQILLVQVVKEERGNKGAALTTYLSLAGRYSVLMPNTARGGGISRKITNTQDRKRLKEVVADLEVPQGMGVILRTAGESRTKAEIKRDYEYLMRLWENVRNLTLQSTAPALVYEEGSLIKRSVRDLYNKEIDEILVSGEDGYREAKDFMRMLMPSHAKMVQPYRDTTPIFVRSGIEAQLDRMLQPQVTLKSGGYIIINQTEALVAIDVNSGRSTKEHSIEETALHTNLEAAEEVARQLRLRDLAGLIVIDFIDMEENRNNRAVEKRLKDHLKNDRARIQLGRISHFGLMEMSRQRIRASVLESTMKPCPHCGGTGHVRSESSVALLVVRAIEEFLLKDSRSHITVKTPASTALYVLNHKRANLAEFEVRFGVTITIEMDDSVGSQHYAIFRGAIAEKPLVSPDALPAPAYIEPEDESDEIVEAEVDEAPVEQRAPHQPQPRQAEGGEDGNRDRKRRRRRRRRGGKDRDHGAPREGGFDAQRPVAQEAHHGDSTTEDIASQGEGLDEVDEGLEEVAVEGAEVESAEDAQARKRRRGKRGGKRNRKDGIDAEGGVQGDAQGASWPDAEADPATPAEAFVEEVIEAKSVEEPEQAELAEKPKKPRRAAKPKKAAAEAVEVLAVEEAVVVEQAQPAEPQAPAPQPTAEAEKPASRSRRKPGAPIASGEPIVALISTDAGETTEAAEDKPKKGWWQRRSFF